MISTHPLTVGDTVYEVASFTTTKSIDILQRLLNAIGPAAAEFIGNTVAGEGGEDEIETIAFGKSVQLLMSGIGGDGSLSTLVKDLLSQTTINGQGIPFETHWPEKFGNMSAVLAHVLKVNYKSFFEGSDFVSLMQQARDRIYN